MSRPIVGHVASLTGGPGQKALLLSLVDVSIQNNFEVGAVTPDVQLVLLALTPSIEDVKHVKTWIAKLLASGFPREKIGLYLFGAGCPGGLSIPMIEDEVGPLMGRLPYDPELALSCENEGVTIFQKKPKSALAKSLAQLAQKISETLNSRNGTVTSQEGSVFSYVETERVLIQNVWKRLSLTNEAQSITSDGVFVAIDLEMESYLLKGAAIPPDVYDGLRQSVHNHVMGFGPLQKWMNDAMVNEIMVTNGSIFIEKDGRIQKTNDMFQSEQELRMVVDRMVSRSGRRVDLSSPMVDVRLDDGARVNIILPPLSLQGPAVTIRKFRPHFKSIAHLIEVGTLTQRQADVLEGSVKTRKNILIAGNTGSGKTTLLNILSGFIPREERIITLEDTAELSLQQEHVVRLETRARNAEGAGAVSMAELLINALRMRPDRIVIGECRGAEVVPMIQAMNTGHDGSLTTVHSNSAWDALSRLESMISMTVPQWPPAFVREQLAAGLDLIIYLKRQGVHRTLTEIAELEYRDGRIFLEAL